MLNVLMVDDSDFKIDTIKSVLGSQVHLDVEMERNSGLRRIIAGSAKYDLLILDMQFPLLAGEQIIRNAGELFLRELKRKGIFVPTIIYSSCISNEISVVRNKYPEYICDVIVGYSVDIKNKVYSALGLKEDY